jgi:hypothetical protein
MFAHLWRKLRRFSNSNSPHSGASENCFLIESKKASTMVCVKNYRDLSRTTVAIFLSVGWHQVRLFADQPIPKSVNMSHFFHTLCNSDHPRKILRPYLASKEQNNGGTMRPTVVCSSDGAAPPLRYLFFGGYLRMTTSEPFTPATRDPDKAPRPPTYDQPAADKPGRQILLPTKLKAALQWPPDCLWPFTGSIGHHGGWDTDA